MINDGLLKSENKKLFRYDIAKFVLKPENIKTIDEYKQVIALIKEKLLGTIEVTEILNFIHLGETVFEDEFQELLDTIFTNFDDSFGQFMRELSHYYAKDLGNTTLSIYNNFNNSEDFKKTNDFKILNKNKLLRVMLKIIPNQIEKNKDNLDKVLPFFNFFVEIYYPVFNLYLYF